MFCKLISKIKKQLPIQIIIYGRHSNDWMEALGSEVSIWREIKNVSVVRNINDSQELSKLKKFLGLTVAIPLMEKHISEYSQKHYHLIPSANALNTLANKKNFYDFCLKLGLTSHIPESYPDIDSAIFPCVIKRTNLNAGLGIEIIRSKKDFCHISNSDTWAGHPYILQEYIPGSLEYVTHAVCLKGEVIWNSTYTYSNLEMKIRRGPSTVEKCTSDTGIVPILEEFTKVLNYNGPLNLDYKIHAGRIIIFEINPRLGGSLMKPENKPDLRMALNCIISGALGLHQK